MKNIMETKYQQEPGEKCKFRFMVNSNKNKNGFIEKNALFWADVMWPNRLIQLCIINKKAETYECSRSIRLHSTD